jgi:hypothetical protein
MLDGDAHMDNQRLGTTKVVWVGLLDFLLENASINLNESRKWKIEKISWGWWSKVKVLWGAWVKISST